PLRVSHLRRGLAYLFARVGRSRRTHPFSFGVRRATRGPSFLVAGSVALHHAPELVPVDRAEIPVFRCFVEAKIGIGEDEVDGICLGNREINEALAQLVVPVSLYAPAHDLLGVRGILM